MSNYNYYDSNRAYNPQHSNRPISEILDRIEKNRTTEQVKDLGSKNHMEHHAGSSMAKTAAKGLFGTGWKAALVRSAVAAIPGVITGS